MAEVISITERLEQERFYSRLFNLQNKLDEYREDIKKDPLKYLDKAREINGDLSIIIEGIRDALYPQVDATWPDNLNAASIETFESIMITKEDYNCLIKIRKIMESVKTF